MRWNHVLWKMVNNMMPKLFWKYVLHRSKLRHKWWLRVTKIQAHSNAYCNNIFRRYNGLYSVPSSFNISNNNMPISHCSINLESFFRSCRSRSMNANIHFLRNIMYSLSLLIFNDVAHFSFKIVSNLDIVRNICHACINILYHALVSQGLFEIETPYFANYSVT